MEIRWALGCNFVVLCMLQGRDLANSQLTNAPVLTGVLCVSIQYSACQELSPVHPVLQGGSLAVQGCICRFRHGMATDLLRQSEARSKAHKPMDGCQHIAWNLLGGLAHLHTRALPMVWQGLDPLIFRFQCGWFLHCASQPPSMRCTCSERYASDFAGDAPVHNSS